MKNIFARVVIALLLVSAGIACLLMLITLTSIDKMMANPKQSGIGLIFFYGLFLGYIGTNTILPLRALKKISRPDEALKLLLIPSLGTLACFLVWLYLVVSGG